MIVFADTSALVKLYVDEPESNQVESMVAQLGFPCVSVLAWAEFHSAVYRGVRTKTCTSAESRSILEQFKNDWPKFGKINIDGPLIMSAGHLISRHPLAALDAIQLASAMEFQSVIEEPVLFLTFDDQLGIAAHREKLKTRV